MKGENFSFPTCSVPLLFSTLAIWLHPGGQRNRKLRNPEFLILPSSPIRGGALVSLYLTLRSAGRLGLGVEV